MPYNPKSLANLTGGGPTRFQPGHPALPRHSPFESLRIELLAALEERTPDGRTHRRRIIDAMIKQSESGDVQAASFLWDRTYGRVPLAIEADLTLTPAVIALDQQKAATTEEWIARGQQKLPAEGNGHTIDVTPLNTKP